MNQTNIRIYVSNLYDIQKLRVAAGNRIVQLLKNSLDISEETSINDNKTISTLKKEFSLISNYCKDNGTLPKTAIKNLTGNGNKKLIYIISDSLFFLMSSYINLIESEDTLAKVLDKEVKSHPMWDKFFSAIKGCGTLMAGVCLAYLDPYKAKYISSFYRYAGVDTVTETDTKGNTIYNVKVNGLIKDTKVTPKYYYETADGDKMYGDFKEFKEDFITGEIWYKNKDGSICRRVQETDGKGSLLYTEIETGSDYAGDVVLSQVGRRRWNTEEFEYVDKNGEVKTKKGLTYNPILKTKLLGVLAPSMIVHGGKGAGRSEYRKIYDNYRSRLDKSSKHKDYTDLHKYNMAIRYMIKQFLRNLHTVWRDYEGLPDYGPYEEVVLGHKPHKLKENF